MGADRAERNEARGGGDRVTPDRRGDRSEIRDSTDVRPDRVEGGVRREGRFVVIGGRRVVYNSPEYRRLIVTERTGPRERYVVIRGQRVLRGSPEYQRLVSTREERFVVIRGQRVRYGSDAYRRLSGGGTVNARFHSETRTSVNTDTRVGRDGVRGDRDRAKATGETTGRDARNDGIRNGDLRGDKGQGGVRNASDRGGDQDGAKPTGSGAKMGGAERGGQAGVARGGKVGQQPGAARN